MNIKKFTLRLCTVAKSVIFFPEGLFFAFFFNIPLSFLCLCVAFFFFVSLLQALVNTNSFCQGICGCVWIETETWEHWACLLLIEYAWLGFPGAVSDERRMKMLMFVELSWVLKDLLSLLTYVPYTSSGGRVSCFRGRIPTFHSTFNSFKCKTKSSHPIIIKRVQ